ncbi:hypothetical protein [Phytohabitans kaempferiae]|uniref:Anti-sigma-D factor RsdA sigma factor binding region domain-containing protein n=1 Tax=Phytohabitans kaempferiae TaxID=1620943 RepID=A0ABV6MHF3_9ACTN
MSGSGKEQQPVGLARIAADDELLDALGRGETPDGDLTTELLAAWRADLADEAPSPVATDPPPPVATGPAAAAGEPPAPSVRVAAGDPARKRRLVQALLGAAAAAVVAVGFAVSTHQAQPGSPLWPVSKVVYPQRAEALAAEKAIADARTAAAAGRVADARALLATASAHIARIDDPATAKRLRADVDALMGILTAAAPQPPTTTAPPAPPPSTAPAPGTGPSAPSTSKSPPPPSGGAPAPESSPSPPGGGLLPDLPLPTPLLPLPDLPLPSLLPILPG